MVSVAVDIVIPSYNGGYLLQKHLPNVLKFTPNLGKIIIIDDGSTDNTAEIVTRIAPKATVLKNPTNIGFTKSVNRGMAQATSPYVVLLNNDVEPKPNYLNSSLDLLQDPKVAAVTFSEDQHSWALVTLKDGKISFQEGVDKTTNRIVAWPSGGSCLLKRSVWLQISGYNPIYSPGYWEDIDLGWRINKLGYHIIWDSSSKVVHQHESTFKNQNQNKLNLLKSRNELIFNWLNLNTPSIRIAQTWWLIKYSFAHPGYLKVILSAFAQLLTNKYQYTTGGDEAIFSKVNQPA